MVEQDLAAVVEMEKARAYEACRGGEIERALEHARQALRLSLESPNPVFAAGSLDVLGDMLQRSGALDEARSAYAAALDLYRKLGSQVGQANVELSLGHLSERVGDLGAARRHFQAALEGYARADRPRGQGQARVGLGLVGMREGELEQAGKEYAAALELFERLGDRRQVAEVRLRMGRLVAETEPRRAIEELEAVLRVFVELKDPLDIANVHAALARARASLPDSAGAQRHLREAIALYEETRAHRGRAESLGLLGDLHVANRDYVLALEAFHRATEVARLAGLPGLAAWMSFRVGCVMAAQGQVAEALAAAEEARRIIADTPLCDRVSEIDEWIALARRDRGAGGEGGDRADGDVTSLEEGALRLVEMAQALMLVEQFGQALEKQMAAESMIRTSKRDHPDEQRHTYMLASLLYAKASCLHAVGRVDDAIAALEESQRGYTDLRNAGRVEMERFIVDVRARKGRFEAVRGRGASAVMESDAALTTYLRLHTRPGTVPQLDDLLDLARIVSANAFALWAYGDPDLAVISADHAITIYFTHARAINASPHIAHMHTGYLRSAARIATEIHAVHGRLEIAIQAADLYTQTARTRAQNESPDHASELARALAWKGLIWQARGGGLEAVRCLDESRSVESSVAQTVEEAWQMASKGRHPLRNTLAAALEIAARELGSTRVRADMVQSLVARPTEGSAVFTPSARCSSEEARPRARHLAGLATELFASAPDAALRLGLEAHYLFSAASRENPAAFRDELSKWGIPWARVLLACSRDYRNREDLPMAVDLSEGCTAVARQLEPFAKGEPALRSLLDEIDRHHAALSV